MQFQFRKLFAAGTAAVMLLSGMTFFQTTASAEGTMTADDITENMTIGWNIGNSLDSTGYDETSWGNPRVTQELIDTVKASAFDGSSGVRTKDGYYTLADDIGVYVSEQSGFISLQSAKSNYTSFRVYANKSAADGGKIRVIVAS